MRWTWAILLLAGGRAERRVVVEDFEKAGLWTDTGEVLGLPESIQPPIGTINLKTEGETLRFDYDVAFRALYGAAVLGRTFYDATTRVTIEVTVKGDVTRDFTPMVILDVEACDQAFVEEPPTVQLDILAPPSSSKNNASAEGRPRNLAPSSSFWANPPRAQQGPDGRPALSRATTWRTSAPRLAHEDSKEDLNV